MGTLTRLLPDTPDSVAEAARVLAEGGLIAFPTETVYGLGADASDGKAVAAVFAAKGRPEFNPLITHVPDRTTAEELVIFTETAHALAEAFWPGPLTLVLKRRPDCPLSDLVSAGLDTAAVRVPGNDLARRLIAAAGVPVAAPSANRSGAVSPTTARHVLDGFEDGVLAGVLDGGACSVGVESTVIDATGDRPVLLRPGGVAVEDLEPVAGPPARAGSGGAPRSPGMLERHYAPSKPLRLNAAGPRPGEAFLGFGGLSAPLNLSRSGDVTEAAANLFAMLRELDRGRFPKLAVAPIPETGLGLAINDRLRRAATRDTEAANDWEENRGPAMPCLAVTDPDDEGD